MSILLITPPLVHPNTPYPAVPTLAAMLKRDGVSVAQFDMSLAVARRVMSAEGVRRVRTGKAGVPPAFFLAAADTYERLVEPARDFLAGAHPEFAHLFARRGFFPEGPSFAALGPDPDETLALLFGSAGVHDRAKHLASLFLDDIALAVCTALDPDFGFSRYAESLAAAAPSFTPLYERLRSSTPTYIDELIDEFTLAQITLHKPDTIGVTAPFPGTVYGAFRVAESVRRHAPHIKTILGGGYINTELREATDPRIREFFDEINFDGRQIAAPTNCTNVGAAICRPHKPDINCTNVGAAICRPHKPDFILHPSYFSLLESANPAHRLWSDGKWLKLQLAQGCYWHKCAFCDTSLPYIRDYSPSDPKQIADVMTELAAETGISAFHFTDEAIPPALLSKLCDEIIKRKFLCTWWGNIRFDTAFTPTLAAKMREAGCIAVTGGLECANDRLLALMNKGITLNTARRVCAAFADNGILVHAYLMYGFPTQTKKEAITALDFTRRLYRDGLIQSSYWHRFALTCHSPIAKNPDAFGIKLLPFEFAGFAKNEISYTEPKSPDWTTIGKALHTANYNFMRGAGLDIPAREWLVR